MIYGRTPGGRHSLSSSQDKPRKFGGHMPFDGLCLVDDGDSLKKICAHHVCTLGLQFVMGTGRQQMKAIRETIKTTVMISSSRSKPSNAQMKSADPRLAPLLAHLDLLLNLGEVCAT